MTDNNRDDHGRTSLALDRRFLQALAAVKRIRRLTRPRGPE
jgi:hypothetical protein